MTVIIYSSTAGSLLREIHALEHPSASGNVAEPLSKIVEPWTMLDPSKNPTLEFCGVKGQKWIKKRDGNRKAEVEKATRKRETWGKGVRKMKRERRETQCNIRNKYHKEVRKDLKSGRECSEGRHKSKTDDSGTLSPTETEGAIKQKEKKKGKKKRWSVFPLHFHLKNISEGEVKRGKNMMKGMRSHRIFLWFILLLFSLCPKTASSQVRVAFKSESNF